MIRRPPRSTPYTVRRQRQMCIRDRGAIDKLMEQQAVVLPDGTDADLIAFSSDELEAAVQIFHVRSGRIRGQRGWVVERSGDQATTDAVREGEPDPGLPALIQNFLIQFYSDAAERQRLEAEEDAKLELSLIHISEPTRPVCSSRMPSSA